MRTGRIKSVASPKAADFVSFFLQVLVILVSITQYYRPDYGLQ